MWKTHGLFRMIAMQDTCRSDETRDVPSWCLSGSSSNCNARNLVRRCSGAQKSTSANCCSKRRRRAAHVAFIASAAASGPLAGPPGPPGPRGLDAFHALGPLDSLDCDFSCVPMRTRTIGTLLLNRCCLLSTCNIPICPSSDEAPKAAVHRPMPCYAMFYPV